MFNNLIESSSHKNEIKRRGSFLLFTTATYALLFAIAGVASIYAYDARLNEQPLELVTMVPIEALATEVREPERPNEPATGNRNPNDSNVHSREILMARTNQPIAPDDISSAPNSHLPIPTTGIVVHGPDADPGGVGSRGTGSGSANGEGGNPVVIPTEPPPNPPEPKPSPKPQVVRKNIINSEAISLPVPIYPKMAQQIRLQGTVLVQVLIDETGKVVSAQVVKGNPMLAPAAKQAAYLARFSPTLIGDQPVKVSGTITYNFVMQ